MNLHRPNANEVLQTKNRSRNVAPQSGICSRCLDGCKGNCDMFQATFRGRELLYPQPFGKVTAGADKDYLGMLKREVDTDSLSFNDKDILVGLDDLVKGAQEKFKRCFGETKLLGDQPYLL